MYHFLQLDFAGDRVFCMGRDFPIGSIAVFAMNVTAAELEQLRPRCTALQSFRHAFNRGKVQDAHILSAKLAALSITEFMSRSDPFRPLGESEAREVMKNLFTRRHALLASQIKETDASKLSGETYEGLAMLRATDVLANFADAVEILQGHMVPFAESLMDGHCPRTREGYADAFRTYFAKSTDLSDPYWTSMVNATVQYKTAQPESMAAPVIVTSMEFVSLGGLFRADFFEGLRVGHAPKRCAVCGRWFLTTNARNTKYCGNVNPDDPRGLTCRQLGAQMGIAHKEKAPDHPLKIIHDRTANTIDKRYSRGKLTAAQQAAMKRLAADKMTRAISDPAYANESYPNEMNVDALLAEVLKTA